MSMDYFGQFVWDNDYIFPEYLAKMFWIDPGPYEQGQGTLLEAGMKSGEGLFRLRRVLVETTSDGGRWWVVEMETEFDRLYFEVLVSSINVPVSIRYIHPESGDAREYITIMAEQMEQSGLSPETMKELLSEKMNQEFDREREYLFSNPVILGEEAVQVPAGKFMAVHVQDEIAGDVTTTVDYRISPDVPGGIIRITYTSPESDNAYGTELTEISHGNSGKIEPRNPQSPGPELLPV